MSEINQSEELLQRAMRACSAREYCLSGINALLERWGADDPGLRERITARLTGEKFIDEHRYSRAFALDHFRHNGWGRVRIGMALREKRVEPEAIASGLEAIDEDEYLALLEKILTQKLKRTKAGSRAELKGKLIRHALSRGFESSLVYDAVNRIVDY